MKKVKKKHDPRLRASAAKKLLMKNIDKKKMVLGNGTKDNDRAPIQPETNDQEKEMMS